MNMLNGTEVIRFFLRVRSCDSGMQGAFPETGVRCVYDWPPNHRIFLSKYVRARKGLKGSIKLETSELVIFCRLIPISLWVGSLLAVAWGGTLCQLGND